MSDIQQPRSVTIFLSNDLMAELRFSSNFAQDMNVRYGLHSPLQEFIDEKIMNELMEYMPKLTGTMINTMITNTVIGSGQIITRTPYVLKQAFQGREPGESQTGPLRGRLWWERWKADNWRSFMDSVRRFNMSN